MDEDGFKLVKGKGRKVKQSKINSHVSDLSNKSKSTNSSKKESSQTTVENQMILSPKQEHPQPTNTKVTSHSSINYVSIPENKKSNLTVSKNSNNNNNWTSQFTSQLNSLKENEFFLATKTRFLDLIKQLLSSSSLSPSLSSSNSEKSIIEIDVICFGVGSLKESKSSRLQLAFISLLIDDSIWNCEAFSKNNVTFKLNKHVYDPLLEKSDESQLSNFNWNLIQTDIGGKWNVDPKKLTIAFMPHCEKFLYHNFLENNWHLLSECMNSNQNVNSNQQQKNSIPTFASNSLIPILLIGNSFENYRLQTPNSQQPKWMNVSQEIALSNVSKTSISRELFLALNDTVFHIFSKQ